MAAEPHSVNTLIAELVQARRQLRQVTQQRYTPGMKAVNMAESALFGLLERHHIPEERSQSAICLRCVARTEAAKFEGHTYRRCLVCQDVRHLGTGVYTILGMLDVTTTLTLPTVANDIVLTAPVWDHQRHEPLNTQPEVLRIVGGQALDYDALLDTLMLHWENRFGGSDHIRKVELVHQPDLGYNSLMLLRHKAGNHVEWV